MLIPKYWAHYKQRFKSPATADNLPKQATIKRYGWSDSSTDDALHHAKARVMAAHQRWLAGADIVRRERKDDYNESSGIPIREQIVFEQTFTTDHLASTQLIVTRNGYGAQVANVDNIAIIDVDNAELLPHLYPDEYQRQGFMGLISITNTENQPQSSTTKRQIGGFIIVSVLLASIIALQGWSWLWLIVVMIGATAFLWQKASKQEQAHRQKSADNLASLLPFMSDLIQKRLVHYPNESFRLYETPAGFRIIATHATIFPSDEVVNEWFAYFYADTNYVRLCQLQQCFRARLTAKPWRMREVTEQNILAKDIPTKDFWSFPNQDIDAEENEPRHIELAAREQWLADYDTFAKGYRACRYIASFDGADVSNSQPVPAAIDEFVKWHNGACQVDRDLPMA